MSNLIEREYDELRSRRVALRQRRDRLVQAAAFGPQNRYGPEGYDNQIVMTEAQLRGTERRWTELCLGPAPPCVRQRGDVGRVSSVSFRLVGVGTLKAPSRRGTRATARRRRGDRTPPADRTTP